MEIKVSKLIPLCSIEKQDILDLKSAMNNSIPVFVQATSGPRIQNIYRVVQMVFHHTHSTNIPYMVSGIKCKLDDNDKIVVLNRDQMAWDTEATATRLIKGKDKRLPTILDQTGAIVEVDDVIAYTFGDQKLEIGTFSRTTPAGSVFVKDFLTRREIKLTKMVLKDGLHPSILKLTNDLRDRLMLIKLSGQKKFLTS
jgi:hypothetical protein